MPENNSSLFHLIQLKNVPIFQQLLIEEQLLRCDHRNFCILNEGSSKAIVMGISGKPQELINPDLMKHSPCPIIKRFSGGGTVIVDENTLFISWICNKSAFSFTPYPEQILQWSETLYKPSFQIPTFALKENDFVIGHKKCGGNALYITKERFLQHTSFLWDYNPKNMDYLLHPKKTPTYRKSRTHTDFLCTLKDYCTDKQTLMQQFLSHLSSHHTILPCTLEELKSCAGPTRISTCYVNLENSK